MKCKNCYDEIETKTKGTMLCEKCYDHIFLASDDERKVIKKKKKSDSILWFISFFIAMIIRNIVFGLIGFKDESFTNGFDILNLLESILILGICFSVVHFLVRTVYKRVFKFQK